MAQLNGGWRAFREFVASAQFVGGAVIGFLSTLSMAIAVRSRDVNRIAAIERQAVADSLHRSRIQRRQDSLFVVILRIEQNQQAVIRLLCSGGTRSTSQIAGVCEGRR